MAQHLARADSSVDGIYDRMEAHGYRGYEMGTRRIGLRHKLWIKPVARAECLGHNWAWNVLWLREGTPHHARITHALRRGDILSK
jgi:hypothetical protein